MSGAVRCAYATDRRFAMQTAASIASLIAHTPPTGLEIVVLHDALPAALREQIGVVAEGASLEFRDVSTKDLRGIELPYYLSTPALFRLLLPDLLPEWPDVLYLDADTLVLTDPTELWDARTRHALASAAEDPGLPRFGSPGGPPWNLLGVSPTHPYFNSGVLLADLAGWRDEEVGPRALALLRSHRLPNGDQCALNTVLLGRIDRLDPRWNVTPPYFSTHSMVMAERGAVEIESIRRMARILHYE